MKITRVLAAFGCAYILAAPAMAQQPGAPARSNDGVGMIANLGKEAGAWATFDTRYEGLKGTPYLVSGWRKSDIKLTDGRVIKDVPTRFDVYGQRLVVRNQADSVWMDTRLASEFVMHDAITPDAPERSKRRFVAMLGESVPSDLRGSYAESLFEGPKYSFYKLARKKLVKANYESAYSADRRFDELVDKSAYYLKRPDGSLVEVRLNSKSLLGAAPALASALKAEMQRRRFSAKTEGEVIELLRNTDK